MFARDLTAPVSADLAIVETGVKTVSFMAYDSCFGSESEKSKIRYCDWLGWCHVTIPLQFVVAITDCGHHRLHA